MKTTIKKFFNVWIFITVFSIIVISSCKTPVKVPDKPVKTKVTNKNEFYSEYSKLLGVELNGNEDKEFIKTVAAWLGTPYKYGGASKEGTDCSGFVKTVYESLYKVSLYRSAADLIKNTEIISRKNLETGDLVFFKINSSKVSHVGIYINENKFIHASSSKGVIVSDLEMDYYKKYFYCGGRVKSLKQ